MQLQRNKNITLTLLSLFLVKSSTTHATSLFRKHANKFGKTVDKRVATFSNRAPHIHAFTNVYTKMRKSVKVDSY